MNKTFSIRASKYWLWADFWHINNEFCIFNIFSIRDFSTKWCTCLYWTIKWRVNVSVQYSTFWWRLRGACWDMSVCHWAGAHHDRTNRLPKSFGHEFHKSDFLITSFTLKKDLLFIIYFHKDRICSHCRVLSFIIALKWVRFTLHLSSLH